MIWLISEMYMRKRKGEGKPGNKTPGVQDMGVFKKPNLEGESL